MPGGGGKTGIRRARGDSPFALANLDSYTTAKLPPRIHSWIDVRTQSVVSSAFSLSSGFAGDGLSAERFLSPPNGVSEMTEETTGASAPSTASSSDSIIAAAKSAQSASASQASSLVATEVSGATAPPSPSASDLALILARLSSLEQSIHPRLEAVEDAIESLAKRAGSAISPEIAKELAEVQVAVHSLGGAVIGHTGHDAGAFFHSWWKKLKEEMEPAPAPAPSAPAPTPLAAGGAPIPLAK